MIRRGLAWKVGLPAALFALLVAVGGMLAGGALFDANPQPTACGTIVGNPAGNGALVYPMTEGSYRISSPYGPRGATFHAGVDFAALVGTPYYSAMDGTVVAAGPATGFGQWIVVDGTVNGQQVSTVYGHSYPDQILVRVGQQVTAGQQLASVGSNGQSTGPHLHFEVWPGTRLGGGASVDPMTWLGDDAAAAAPSVVNDGSLAAPGIPDQSTMSIDGEQTANVQTIVAVTKARGLSLRTAVLVVAAAMQESLLRNLDYGDRDSYGILQQRPSQGWGTKAQVMDVPYAVGKFLDVLVTIPGYETMPLTAAIQQVQRSGYPLAYAKWETQAAQLVAASADVDPATLAGGGPSSCGVTADGSGPVIPADLIVDNNWPSETATVPDPVRSDKRITPRMAAVVDVARANGWAAGGLGCWDEHPQNPSSDHPQGRACDVFFAYPDPTQIAQGWELANYFVAHQADLGINYLIWQGQYWDDDNPGQWVPYESDTYGCPNPENVTGCHYDHVHISVH